MRKLSIDGDDRIASLCPAASPQMISRLLQRAADKAVAKIARDMKNAAGTFLAGWRRGNTATADLGRELGQALKRHGDVGVHRPSSRTKAPEGGRPFHFAHSVVSKADAPGAASAKPVTGLGKTGKAAAHMRYIEREIAVETLYGIPREAEAERSRDARGRDDGSFDREISDRGPESAAGPGQTYIENPVKLESGEQVLFSFGTIGETFQERVDFWEQLEQAEAHPSARVQHRLIVELPHEASPQARHDMMRAFCRRFEDDKIPFWAALHAPGKKNDSRNFHAHIVYSERPAERIKDPATGELAWDFSVVEYRRDGSRHVQTSRPYRQKKRREYNAKAFIPTLRASFAKIVNEVLARDAVKDRDGAAVLYDARSYAAMGLDVIPQQSIDRIVASGIVNRKSKAGTHTSLHRDYTRSALVEAVRNAGGCWNKDVRNLVALDKTIQRAARSGKPQTRNKALPRELRGSPLSPVSRQALATAGVTLFETRCSALLIDVMERVSIASLERIIAATAPEAIEAAHRTSDPGQQAEAPDAEAAALLYAAATEELAETQASLAKARRLARIRVGTAVTAWKALINAPPLETSPTMKAVIRDFVDQPVRPISRDASASAANERAAVTVEKAQKAAQAPTKEASQTRPAPAPQAQTSRPAPAATSETPVAVKASQAQTSGPRPSPTAAPTEPRPEAARSTQGAKQPEAKKISEGAKGTDAPKDKTGQTKKPFSLAGLDPHTFKMPTVEEMTGPIHPRLGEASIIMGRLINAVKESSDDPDVRMANLEKLHETMRKLARENSQERKREAAAKLAQKEAWAAEDARKAAEPKVHPDQMDLFGTKSETPMAQVTPAQGVKAPSPTAPVPDPERRHEAAPITAVRDTAPSEAPPPQPTPASSTGAGAENVPGTPSTPTVPVPDPAQRPEAVPISAVQDTAPPQAPPPQPTPASSADAGTDKMPGIPPLPTAPADTPVLREEHPADAKRRRKREEEEKAAKKRRAVLAKRNRGRGR